MIYQGNRPEVGDAYSMCFGQNKRQEFPLHLQCEPGTYYYKKRNETCCLNPTREIITNTKSKDPKTGKEIMIENSRTEMYKDVRSTSLG